MLKRTVHQSKKTIRNRRGVETVRGPRKAMPWLPNVKGTRFEKGKRVRR